MASASKPETWFRPHIRMHSCYSNRCGVVLTFFLPFVTEEVMGDEAPSHFFCHTLTLVIKKCKIMVYLTTQHNYKLTDILIRAASMFLCSFVPPSPPTPLPHFLLLRFLLLRHFPSSIRKYLTLQQLRGDN